MEEMAKLGFYCAGNPWLAFPYHATNGGVEGQTLATIWYLLQIHRLQVLHNAPRNIGWNIALRYALILPVVKRERGGWLWMVGLVIGEGANFPAGVHRDHQVAALGNQTFLPARRLVHEAR